MSAQRQEKVRRIAAPDITAQKGKTPIVCLTAYTTPMAELLDESCDLLLLAILSAWSFTACRTRWA